VQAQLAFNTPSAMNIGDTAQIQLLLSLEESIDELKRALEGAGGREGAKVAVAERMEARLSGANFRITAVTPEEQALTSTGRTEWRWEVQPTIAGSHPLHLSLSAVLRVDGASTRRSIRTFDKTIVVQVTLARQASDFVGKNWQWLWAVLVVPVAGWLWRRRRTAVAGRACEWHCSEQRPTADPSSLLHTPPLRASAPRASGRSSLRGP
jgi:hypothetical protein